MVKTPYTLVRVTMTGVKALYCDGLEIEDLMKTEDEYHGGSHQRLSETHKENEVKWKLINPRDHMALNMIVYKCRQGETFTITGFGDDEKGVFRALERLDDCTTLDRKRKFGEHKAVRLEVAGTASKATPILATYD